MNSAWIIDSGKPGPVVAIFGGTHGNEKAGVFAIEELKNSLTLKKGRVHLVITNPPAVKKNVRMMDVNLNRLFDRELTGDTWEHARAADLMGLLDECDALLDLHMYYDAGGEPFVICEPSALPVANLLDVSIISTNWTKVEPGAADGYMHEQGKIGICLECGPIAQAHQKTDFAIQSVKQFLAFFDMLDYPLKTTTPKRLLEAQKVVYKSSNNFKLAPNLKNFQNLLPGQLIATDGQRQYTAAPGECIMFPHYNARVGEETYILGKGIKL